jgi:hypothetical protein
MREANLAPFFTAVSPLRFFFGALFFRQFFGFDLTSLFVRYKQSKTNI